MNSALMKVTRSSRNPLSFVGTERRILVVASLGLLLFFLPACAIRSTSSGSPTILLFNGNGTSSNDVTAIEKILSENDFSYTTANSQQLNEMSESQLRAYRLLIIPGGNFEQIGNGLTSSATANVRNAVHKRCESLSNAASTRFLNGPEHNHANEPAEWPHHSPVGAKFQSARGVPTNDSSFRG
jgi:hypothetical protein